MKKIFTRIFTAIMLATLFGLAACKKQTSYDYPPSEGTVYQIMKDDAVYANFKVAVDRAGLQDIFDGSTEYTFFLPTTEALNGAGLTTAVLQNMPTADAATLVKNHIVAGKVDPLTATAPLATLGGRPINILRQGTSFYAEGNDITGANIVVKGGYLNTINGVLYVQNSLLDIVRNYQHPTTNSKIDFTLAAITRASTGTVNFTNLLSGAVDYTFFAPTNNAWIAYGYATAAAVTAAPAATLVEILKLHLVPNARLKTGFDSVGVAAYGNGNIYFNKYKNFRSTDFFVNGILSASGTSNVLAKNGVLHVIPWVLRPAATKNTLEQIQGDATLSVFYAAILRASTADPAFNFQAMLSGTTPYTVFAVNNAGMAAAGYPNVAAVDATAPADLARIIKYHIVARRVHYINVGGGNVNTLLVTTSGTGAPVVNALTFSATYTTGVSGTFRVKGASNTTDYAVLSPNTTTTNGMLNIVPTLLER